MSKCGQRPPKTADLNAVVSEMQRIFRAVVGDGVALCTSLDPELGLVAGDMRDIGALLVNLFIQARDATPAEGEVFVATENLDLDATAAAVWQLSPGKYALLRIAVAGDIQPAGVRGMVEQLGGAIAARRAPDGRMAIKVVLPQAAQ